MTVNPTPSTISSSSGFFAVEVGSTITLSSSPTGGTWGSSNAYATVNLVTGVVTGVAAGAANISYTNTSGCYRVVFLSITSFADTLLEKRIYTIAGTGVAGYSGDGGLATDAKLNKQSYLAKDLSGNIYFSDRYNRRVRKIATNGIITTVAGNGTSGSGGDGGPATAAPIAQVSGLALDADGNLYIGDYDGNKIRKVNTAGIITTFAGTGASSSTGDGGHATAASIKTPIGLSFDHSGNLLIVEQYGHKVRKITPGSNIISTIIGTGVVGYTGNGGPATAAKISYPNTIFIDSADNIYVTDNGNHALRKINTAGIISTIAGNGLEGFLGDGGPATSARLDYPAGATMDASGNIYIADYGNHRVRKINTSGIISTYVGTGTSGYNSDCINPTTA
jgi:sugar lactone lactonase YvrE